LAEPYPKLAGLQIDEALRLLRTTGYPDPASAGLEDTALLQWLVNGLCELSQRDGLTGLANARQLRLALESELDRVARTGEGAALLYVDIDHLARVNDSLGRAAGDAVLRMTATVLAGAIRPMDLAGRYQGDEFLVILPSRAPALARAIAERLRERIAGTPVSLPDGSTVPVTVSIGVAFAMSWERVPAARLIEVSERQMHQAKLCGCNCVSLARPPSTAVSADERAMLFEPAKGKKND